MPITRSSCGNFIPAELSVEFPILYPGYAVRLILSIKVQRENGGGPNTLF